MPLETQTVFNFDIGPKGLSLSVSVLGLIIKIWFKPKTDFGGWLFQKKSQDHLVFFWTHSAPWPITEILSIFQPMTPLCNVEALLSLLLLVERYKKDNNFNVL